MTNAACPICLTGEMVQTSRDTFCMACGDDLLQPGSCWFDGRGVVRVMASFLDRHGLPYAVVQARRGNPRIVSQGMMLREWQLRPEHIDNRVAAAVQVPAK